MYDLAIIGGGPAGSAAAVDASRKRLKTLFLTVATAEGGGQDFGGQSVVSADIQHWIGTVSVSGTDLAHALERHVRAYASDVVDVHTAEKVTGITKIDGGFSILTEASASYHTKTLLVATGSTRRKITVPGADIFEHKGIPYCASCDGPLFAGRDVVVLGGGNAAFETAAQLLAYAKSVTLLHRSEGYRADPVTVEKILANPKMTAITNAELLEIHGDKFVTDLSYKDKITGETRELKTGGIFVEIGLIPSTSFLEGVVKLNEYKQVVVDPKTQQTSVHGIWAAGDATDGLYHQNNIAAGDIAVNEIFQSLEPGGLFQHNGSTRDPATTVWRQVEQAVQTTLEATTLETLAAQVRDQIPSGVNHPFTFHI